MSLHTTATFPDLTVDLPPLEPGQLRVEHIPDQRS